MNKANHKTPSLPSKSELLGFIGRQKGKVGTREIARAFGLKNAMRAELKRLLRELSDEGAVEKRHKKLHHPGTLPSTVLADILERDSDGELIAKPDRMGRGGAWTRRRKSASHPAQSAPRRSRRRRRPRAAPRRRDRRGSRHPPPRARDQDHRSPQSAHARHLPRRPARRRPAGAGRQENSASEIVIPQGASGGAEDGDLVAVEVGRSPRLGLATGRVVERLGSLKSERAVSLIAIHAHQIPQSFRRDTLAEAEAAKPATLRDREDWRDVPFVTIDPPDAKDHDDAVHAAPTTTHNNRGGFILSVAIADVAHYVTPGSALDREALARGNSVYFPDRVVPMLPERISNDLCSLRAARGPRRARRAHGHRRRRTQTLAHIPPHHDALGRQASYEQTQLAIGGRTDDDTETLVEAGARARFMPPTTRSSARATNARPLDLDLPERKILLKPDGTVDRVIAPERLEAHRLIEEFMILANVAAAETLEKARVPLIYRVHDEPSGKAAMRLREFLATLDIPLPRAACCAPDAFNGVLARVKGRDTEQLVNEVVLRSQAQAEYAAENYGHFGLNLRRYAHFTSPIRRYADLIVHRGLIRALKLGPDGLAETSIPRRWRDRRGNFRHRAARHARRA